MIEALLTRILIWAVLFGSIVALAWYVEYKNNEEIIKKTKKGLSDFQENNKEYQEQMKKNLQAIQAKVDEINRNLGDL